MTDIFKNLIYKKKKGVVVYLDDIIISTEIYEDHVDLVRAVLRRLKTERFYIKKEKCQLLTKELKILGHIVTPQWLRAVPNKITNTMKIERSRHRQALQAFIGIVNYLSKFCPNLASHAAILTDLQGSTAKWMWGPTYEEVFNQCKALIKSDKIIKPFNYDSPEPIYLVTDASDIGTGACLGQGTLDKLQSCMFHSRKFDPSQLKYPAFLKLLLAIIDAVMCFEP